MVVKRIDKFKVEIEANVYKQGGGAAMVVPKEFAGHRVRATIEIIE